MLRSFVIWNSTFVSLLIIMGLGFVEILMEIEDAFGVKIEGEDLIRMSSKGRFESVSHLTVGDLYDLILEKRKTLNLPKGKVRPEVFAMRDVRLALAEVLQMSPEDFRPQDRLSRLLPRDDRRKLWRRLRRALGRKLPALMPDRPWNGAIRWVVFAAATFGAGLLAYRFIMADQLESHTWLLAVPILAGISAFVGMMLSHVAMAFPIWPFKGIPRDVRTVELLAKSHLARNRRHYIDECGGDDTDEDAWYTLQIILVDTLGVDIDQVTKEADLVRDLGAD